MTLTGPAKQRRRLSVAWNDAGTVVGLSHCLEDIRFQGWDSKHCWIITSYPVFTKQHIQLGINKTKNRTVSKDNLVICNGSFISYFAQWTSVVLQQNVLLF